MKFSVQNFLVKYQNKDYLTIHDYLTVWLLFYYLAESVCTFNHILYMTEQF